MVHHCNPLVLFNYIILSQVNPEEYFKCISMGIQGIEEEVRMLALHTRLSPSPPHTITLHLGWPNADAHCHSIIRSLPLPPHPLLF
jgi:hypothetical protein